LGGNFQKRIVVLKAELLLKEKGEFADIEKRREEAKRNR
jgi:hypothetical protein